MLTDKDRKARITDVQRAATLSMLNPTKAQVKEALKRHKQTKGSLAEEYQKVQKEEHLNDGTEYIG